MNGDGIFSNTAVSLLRDLYFFYLLPSPRSTYYFYGHLSVSLLPEKNQKMGLAPTQIP